jgi:hypothetical protein
MISERIQHLDDVHITSLSARDIQNDQIGHHFRVNRKQSILNTQPAPSNHPRNRQPTHANGPGPATTYETQPQRYGPAHAVEGDSITGWRYLQTPVATNDEQDFWVLSAGTGLP